MKTNQFWILIDFSDPEDYQKVFSSIKQELDQYVSYPKGSVENFTENTSVLSERVFSHAQSQVLLWKWIKLRNK